MVPSSTSLSVVLLPLLAAGVWAQTEVTGRVIDETGAGVEGARVELRGEDAAAPAVASSDLAGNFKLTLKSAGIYAIRAERKGYYQDFGRPEQIARALEQGFVFQGEHCEYLGASRGMPSAARASESDSVEGAGNLSKTPSIAAATCCFPAVVAFSNHGARRT